SYTGLYVPRLPATSPTVLSTSGASTVGLKPLYVKDDLSVISADYAHKQASSLLGKPLPDEFILNITNVGSYARKKVPITLIREEGHVAIIKALDVSNMNRLEMRAIDQQWR
ncbi:hypothetical protein FOZ61_004932, partial [Perkinsus olseni]